MQAHKLLYPTKQKSSREEVRIEKILQMVQKAYGSQRREKIRARGEVVSRESPKL